MKTKPRYITNPQEVYALELNKLQRSFSTITKIGEGASELVAVGWRQVEYLRQMNFMLEEAIQVGEMVQTLDAPRI